MLVPLLDFNLETKCFVSKCVIYGFVIGELQFHVRCLFLYVVKFANFLMFVFLAFWDVWECLSTLHENKFQDYLLLSNPEGPARHLAVSRQNLYPHSLVRVIARQLRDKDCLAAIFFASRHQDVSSGPLGNLPFCGPIALDIPLDLPFVLGNEHFSLLSFRTPSHVTFLCLLFTVYGRPQQAECMESLGNKMKHWSILCMCPACGQTNTFGLGGA